MSFKNMKNLKSYCRLLSATTPSLFPRNNSISDIRERRDPWQNPPRPRKIQIYISGKLATLPAQTGQQAVSSRMGSGAPMSVTSSTHRSPSRKKICRPGPAKKTTGPPRQSIGGPSRLSDTGKNNPLLLLGFVVGIFAVNTRMASGCGAVGRSDVHTHGSKNKYKPFITEYLPLSVTVEATIDVKTRDGSVGARGPGRIISLTHTYSSGRPWYQGGMAPLLSVGNKVPR